MPSIIFVSSPRGVIRWASSGLRSYAVMFGIDIPPERFVCMRGPSGWVESGINIENNPGFETCIMENGVLVVVQPAGAVGEADAPAGGNGGSALPTLVPTVWWIPNE